MCVIDSGVDTDTDLGPALVKRSAFDGGTLDDTGAKADQAQGLAKHGTYVAGVIGSQIDGVGTNGIWPAARIISRRVFAGPGSGTTAQDYIRAIQWCIQDPTDGVKVINLSLSGLSATLEERARLEDKIAQVRQPPYSVNVIAAAGNNGLSHVGYPASGSGVLAVGATGPNGALASFSNRGTGLDISTLGVATCVTTGYGTRLAEGEGTSYAAPVVSAVFAALRSARPDLTPAEAEQLLLENADATLAGKALNAAKTFVAAGLLTSQQAATIYPSNPCEAPPDSTGGNGIGSGNAMAATLDATSPTSASEPAPSVPPQQAPAPVVAVHPPTDDLVPGRKPARPTLRAITYRKGVLTVRVAGMRKGDRAIFQVSRRIRVGARGTPRTAHSMFVRSTATLSLRVSAWTSVRVQLHRPGVGTSGSLTVDRMREF